MIWRHLVDPSVIAGRAICKQTHSMILNLVFYVVLEIVLIVMELNALIVTEAEDESWVKARYLEPSSLSGLIE